MTAEWRATASHEAGLPTVSRQSPAFAWAPRGDWRVCAGAHRPLVASRVSRRSDLRWRAEEIADWRQMVLHGLNEGPFDASRGSLGCPFAVTGGKAPFRRTIWCQSPHRTPKAAPPQWWSRTHTRRRRPHRNGGAACTRAEGGPTEWWSRLRVERGAQSTRADARADLLAPAASAALTATVAAHDRADHELRLARGRAGAA